jgi:hypothetical protein
MTVTAADRVLRSVVLRPRAGQLRVRPNVATASVSVDDVPLGRGAVSWSGAPGLHRLRVEAAGYRPLRQPVTIQAGQTVEVVASLDAPRQGSPQAPGWASASAPRRWSRAYWPRCSSRCPATPTRAPRDNSFKRRRHDGNPHITGRPRSRSSASSRRRAVRSRRHSSSSWWAPTSRRRGAARARRGGGVRRRRHDAARAALGVCQPRADAADDGGDPVLVWGGARRRRAPTAPCRCSCAAASARAACATAWCCAPSRASSKTASCSCRCFCSSAASITPNAPTGSPASTAPASRPSGAPTACRACPRAPSTPRRPSTAATPRRTSARRQRPRRHRGGPASADVPSTGRRPSGRRPSGRRAHGRRAHGRRAHGRRAHGRRPRGRIGAARCGRRPGFTCDRRCRARCGPPRARRSSCSARRHGRGAALRVRAGLVCGHGVYPARV